MNSLAFYNPRFTSDLFDVIDRNFANLMPSENERHTFTPRVDIRETPPLNQMDLLSYQYIINIFEYL